MRNGDLGCFDEHGIFPIAPLRRDGKVVAYTCGWSRRVSTAVETGIGYAVSDDNGETFTRYGSGPIMSASLHEPFLVGDPFVRVCGGAFHMWYIFGVRWIRETDGTPARVYKIGHAMSGDGIAWERNGVESVAGILGPDECQALPTVVERNGAYHMFFCYRHATDFRTNPARGYRIGYAVSSDGTTWERRQDAGIDVSPTGWDSEMQCYPHVFECGGTVYLLYNGNAFGRFGFGLAEWKEA
jgi:hypothetical protein